MLRGTPNGLAHTYRTQAKIYNDSDELVWLNWRVCPDQTKVPSVTTVFGSDNYRHEAFLPKTGLGEYPATPRIHCDPRPQYPHGLGCWKDASVLVNGILTSNKQNPLGLLPCCLDKVYYDDCSMATESDGYIVTEDGWVVLLEQCPGCNILTEDGGLIEAEYDEPLEQEECE